MLKVAKFGGSSMADAVRFAKVKAIVEADDARRVIVVSAPGKRYKDDHKVTDLLYLCSAHLKYGVSCEKIFALIRQRYQQIADDCGLSLDLAAEFDALWQRMCSGEADEEYLASRGEYFAARLMAEYLGYTFLDAALWLRFKFDGTVDQEASYEALRKAADGQRVVIPGFYGAMPDGRVVTLTRGGSDITGALAAAALDADVYENWTDVSGILMADPRIVENPEPIRRVTYSELRELSYLGAQVLHEGTVFPVREKNIPLNIRNTNDPAHDGTMILSSIDDEEQDESFITGIAGKKGLLHHHHRQERHVLGARLSAEAAIHSGQASGKRGVRALRYRHRVAGGGGRQGRPVPVQYAGRDPAGGAARHHQSDGAHRRGGGGRPEDGVPSGRVR